MIKELFKQLENKSKVDVTTQIFEKSGMINKYNKIGYGFFPLGHGILVDDFDADKTQLKECKIMILGNDFGTDEYLQNKCSISGESFNPTINNLLKNLKLDTRNTFFTNYYLGVRKDGTNTKRIVSLEDNYKKFCFEFFLTQLQTINPQIVICLGHAVREALADNFNLFQNWKGKSKTIKKLHSENRHVINIIDENLGKRKFIIAPHPCDTRNFRKEYVDELLQLIKN